MRGTGEQARGYPSDLTDAQWQVIGQAPGDQAEPVPAFDAGGVGAQFAGDFVEGEQAGVAEPLVMAA